MNWSDLTIVLGLPPSANDLVRPALVGRKARLVSTFKAKAFRTEAIDLLRQEALQHGLPRRLTGPVQINAVFFVPTLASDCNNRWKALEDAITASGVVWDDDKQVSVGISEKRFTEAGEEPHCHVNVKPCISEEHARRLDEAKKRNATKPKRRLGLQPAVYR